MTASITNLTHYRHQRSEKNSMPHSNAHGNPNSYLSRRLRCAEANLVELLVHCAMENLTPREVESLIAPPLRLALDYCIPDTVSILESAMTGPMVALSRSQWRKAIPRALFGRFEPECDDDDFFLVAQLEEAHRELSRALTARG